MEWKIGEIKQVNGEWYQCVEGTGCYQCAFNRDENTCNADNPHCTCRSDKKDVVFKKLEKWGKPYPNADKLYQLYILPMNIEKLPPHTKGINLVRFDIVEIEIKQTKEDMEEKDLVEKLSEKVHNAWMKKKEAQGFSYGKEYDKEKKKHPDMLPYNELKEEVKEYDRVTVKAVLQAQKELSADANKLSFKEFNLEAAKSGKPVCTRDGRKARIICFDKGGEQPIVALIEKNEEESIDTFFSNGHSISKTNKVPGDLMMLPEKKEGWVNVYKGSVCISVYPRIYKSREEAISDNTTVNRIDTVKISWEE